MLYKAHYHLTHVLRVDTFSCKELDCLLMAEWVESWCGRQSPGSLKTLIIKCVVRSYTKIREGRWNSLEVRKTLRQTQCCNCQTHSMVIMLRRWGELRASQSEQLESGAISDRASLLALLGEAGQGRASPTVPFAKFNTLAGYVSLCWKHGKFFGIIS